MESAQSVNQSGSVFLGHYQPCHSPGSQSLASNHVGFVVDKVALGKIFSENFCFPCQFSFHQLLHIHYHPIIQGFVVSILSVIYIPRSVRA
jgi:hypothetical protein